MPETAKFTFDTFGNLHSREDADLGDVLEELREQLELFLSMLKTCMRRKRVVLLRDPNAGAKTGAEIQWRKVFSLAGAAGFALVPDLTNEELKQLKEAGIVIRNKAHPHFTYKPLADVLRAVLFGIPYQSDGRWPSEISTDTEERLTFLTQELVKHIPIIKRSRANRTISCGSSPILSAGGAELGRLVSSHQSMFEALLRDDRPIGRLAAHLAIVHSVGAEIVKHVARLKADLDPENERRDEAEACLRHDPGDVSARDTLLRVDMLRTRIGKEVVDVVFPLEDILADHVTKANEVVPRIAVHFGDTPALPLASQWAVRIRGALRRVHSSTQANLKIEVNGVKGRVGIPWGGLNNYSQLESALVALGSFTSDVQDVANAESLLQPDETTGGRPGTENTSGAANPANGPAQSGASGANREAGTTEEESPVVPAFAHADDFTWIRWGGRIFNFSKGNQAETVRYLWEAWEKSGRCDGCGLSDKTIGEKIGSSSDDFRLAPTFRGHPAWNTLIREVSKGVFALHSISPKSH